MLKSVFAIVFLAIAAPAAHAQQTSIYGDGNWVCNNCSIVMPEPLAPEISIDIQIGAPAVASYPAWGQFCWVNGSIFGPGEAQSVGSPCFITDQFGTPIWGYIIQ